MIIFVFNYLFLLNILSYVTEMFVPLFEHEIEHDVVVFFSRERWLAQTLAQTRLYVGRFTRRCQTPVRVRKARSRVKLHVLRTKPRQGASFIFRRDILVNDKEGR